MGVVKELGNDDGGVHHGALLARLCDAVASKDREIMAGVRREMLVEMGPEQLVDAVGVSAMFHMMTRVANATGTPLDPIMSQAGPAISEAIGAAGFHSRADTPGAES